MKSLAPTYSANYVGNVRLDRAEHSSKLSLSYASLRIKTAYLSYLNPFQKRVALSLTRRAAALINGVLAILFVAAKEKMLGIHTLWHVARMTDAQSDRNNSEVNIPRHAVRPTAKIHPIVTRPSASPEPTPSQISIVLVKRSSPVYVGEPKLPRPLRNALSIMPAVGNFDLHSVSLLDCLSRSRLLHTARGHFHFDLNNVFCKEAI